jgi:hypothetical protein
MVMSSAAKVLLEAGFPTPPLAVVEVLDVQDARLRWTPWTIANRNQRELQRLTVDFLECAEQSDGQILKLARWWGPLGLCEKHGAPMCHGHNGEDLTGFESLRVPTAQLGRVCPPRLEPGVVNGNQLVYSEPVEEWRRWARRARSILLLAEQARQRQPGHPDYWRDLIGKEPAPRDLESAVITLAGVLEFWRWAADMRPKIGVGPDGVSLRLWLVSGSACAHPDTDGRLNTYSGLHGGLFGAIGLHLLLAASAGAGIAHCDHCGRFYLPKKLPRADRPHYCQVCQQNHAKQRVYDQRENAAIRLAREMRRHKGPSSPIPEIVGPVPPHEGK